MDWKGCGLRRGTNLSGGKEEHEINPHCLTPGSRSEHGTFQIIFAFLTATLDDIRHVHTETLRFGIISAYEINLEILETL